MEIHRQLMMEVWRLPGRVLQQFLKMVSRESTVYRHIQRIYRFWPPIMTHTWILTVTFNRAGMRKI